ncbi:MAG: dephospho-CoA kinase [Pirellulales bacterium]|nr:dephospho-CoA kinase [Pirellulales bacterium]
MKIIGIVGGIASGKSLVAARLAELGAGVIDADKIGHEVLRETDVRAALVERWGPTVLGADGEVDRARVGQIVFAPAPDGPRDKAFLESLVHPQIGRAMQERLGQYAAQGLPAVVLDAPLLLEAGMDAWCDEVIYVDASRAVRLQRAQGRGWSEAEFAAREETQPKLAEKMARATVRIDNSGSIRSTQEQVDQFWSHLTPRR